MADDGFLLSEKDRALIQELLDWYRTQQNNTTNRPAVDWAEHQAPEIYVALTPVNGILPITSEPGTGTHPVPAEFPGSAVCKVWQILNGVHGPQIFNTNQTRIVYNISGTAIPGGNWVLITRDKYGSWVAIMTSGGSGGGSGIDLGTATGIHSKLITVVTSVTCNSGTLSVTSQQVRVLP